MSVMIKDGGSSTGSGVGGMFIGGTKLSSEATTVDNNAQFKIISKSNNSSSDTDLFKVNIKKLEIGTYSIMLRMKLSNVTGTNPVLNIKVFTDNASGTLLAEQNIYPKHFEANKFRTVGFNVNFDTKKNTVMHVECKAPSNSESNTIGIDYILVSPSFTSLSSVG